MNTQTNIQKFNWSTADVSAKLANALRSIGQWYPQLVEDANIGRAIYFQQIDAPDGTNVCKVTRKGNSVTIQHNNMATALRGLGTAMGGVNVDESTSFTRLGIMLDCSRGKIPTMQQAKKWLTRLALMGYNYAMYYCEDTYQLPDEPFFGYMRGAFSLAELKEIDDFADSLGIEMIGCMQVLGHLAQILKYGYYNKIADTSSVLMIDNPDAQALIEKMIVFWSQAFRSRRIHIGMDEAHDMLRGKFLDREGKFLNAFEYFNKHLAFVNGICHKYGLKAMIWSDMYFRLENPGHEYYHCRPVPPEVAKHIPQDVELVYWDYYSTDEKTYSEMFKRHQEIGFQPVFGSGCWTWEGRYWYDHLRTMNTVKPGLAAARKCNVTDVFFTLWGDDGAVCDYDSVLAGLARSADLAYGAAPDDESFTSAKFSAICKCNYEGMILAAQLPNRFQRSNGNMYFCNMQMQLLDDPLLGMVAENFEAAVPGAPAKYLQQLIDTQLRLRHFHSQTCGDFVNLNNLLKLLILKLQLRRDFVKAYQDCDIKALKEIAKTRIPDVIDATKIFLESYTTMWLNQARPFGLEVMQYRLGGLIARFEEMQRRVKDYVSGKCGNIPELDARPKLNEQNAQFFCLTPSCQTASVWH